jgi:hypothetical protein
MKSKNLNKRVVIVGNGSNSLNTKNGVFIDNSEEVIRIKGFVLNGFEEYVGSKTTIWNTKWFSYLESNYREDVKLWMPFVDPRTVIENKNIDEVNQYMFLNNFSNKIADLKLHNNLLVKVGESNVEFLSIEELEESLIELKIDANLFYTKGGLNIIHPTTYFYSIFLALKRFRNYEIYITGFDGFTQGYYWNPGSIKKHDKSWPHFYEIEKLYIKKLLYSGKIKNLC